MTNKYDFSDRTSYNGLTCKENEVLVPSVMDQEFKEMLRNYGLKEKYIETWKIGTCKKKVPVAYVPWPSDKFDDGMREFNYKVSEYLKRHTYDNRLISIDKAKDDMFDTDGKGYDMTLTMDLDENLKCEILLEDIRIKMKDKGPEKTLYLNLRIQGFTKKEIFERMDSKLKKTQLYEFAKKADEEIKDIIEELELI